MIIRGNFLAAISFILVSHTCCCEDGYLLLCENQMEDVACPKNSTINVTTATYGYNASNAEARQECNGWWEKWFRDVDSTNCHHPNSTILVANICNGLSHCTISATNKVFGDPCPGVTKYFELYYNCIQDKSEIDSSGKERGNENLDEDRGGGDREVNSNNWNSKSTDDGGLMTAEGYDRGNNYESYSNGDVKQIENECEEENDDDDDDDDDDEDNDDCDDDNDNDDNEDGKGLSAVAIVAIAAGIPIGVLITISIIVILVCSLANPIKRRKKLARTNYRNMSVNQYNGQGLPMTASSNNEDSEMVYNSAYQSVSQDGQSAVKTTGNGKTDEMQINYENVSEEESLKESANTNDEEAVYNEAYQSINGNEPKR